MSHRMMRCRWGNSLHSNSATRGGTPTPALPRKRGRGRAIPSRSPFDLFSSRSSCVMKGAAIRWRLRALVHAVVANDTGNTDSIILEDLRAAFGLALAVLRHVAPRFNGGLIAEKRQRKQFSLLGEALEPLDRDEAVDGFQDRPQPGREVEIVLLMFRLRPDFEDDGDHWLLPLSV